MDRKIGSVCINGGMGVEKKAAVIEVWRFMHFCCIMGCFVSPHNFEAAEISATILTLIRLLLQVVKNSLLSYPHLEQCRTSMRTQKA